MNINLNAFFAVVAFVVFLSQANAADLPKRKPGLWEISVTASNAPGASSVMKHCIDQSTDEKMLSSATQMAGQMGIKCSKNDFRREGDKYIAESDCQMAQIRMQSHSEFSGDFNSLYVGVTKSSYNPPMYGLSSSESTMTARWVGPCQAGQQPGDMIMSNGMKMNINSLPGMGTNSLPRGMVK